METIDKHKIRETILANRWLLRRYQVGSIALFGSYVRGEQRDDSDIDFLVEFENNTYSNFINLVYSLEELFNRSVTVLSEESLSPYIKPYVMKEFERIEG
ncbi:MAG: nucleotidyltransferase family protein [Nitrospirae bacterium YQR-1]